MNNVTELPLTTQQQKWAESVHAFSLREYISEDAQNAMNEPSFIPLRDNPIGFIASMDQDEIQNALQQLSGTSTRGYIGSFIKCLKQMSDFETKVGYLFISSGNKQQRLIMALIYLVNYPKIDTIIYNNLISIMDNCTAHDALRAKNSMNRIGIIWTEETLDDPILAQFLTKASYAENGLQKIPSSLN